MGTGDPENEGELLRCAAAYESGDFDPTVCPWFEKPPKPGSGGSSPMESPRERASLRRTLLDFCDEFPTTLTCEAYDLPAEGRGN
jgi:hypothetical protein